MSSRIQNEKCSKYFTFGIDGNLMDSNVAVTKGFWKILIKMHFLPLLLGEWVKLKTGVQGCDKVGEGFWELVQLVYKRVYHLLPLVLAMES